MTPARSRRPGRPGGAGGLGRRLGLPIAVVAFALVLAAGVEAQEQAHVRDAGPGGAGRILRAALAQPHVLIAGDTQVVRLPRDSVFGRSVVIVGASATVASTVEGDVIVVGGDLFLHPGAMITGRAIAIGGGVYNSTLALVQGERLAFRDATFVATRVGGTLVLDYRAIVAEPSRSIRLAGIAGLGLPTYTRVDGLSLPFGVVAQWDEPPAELEAAIVYRSDLGVVDPHVEGAIEIDRRTWIELAAGRGTFTNDDWIRGDALNTLITLVLGRDVRNYYRADRAEIVIARAWESETAELAPLAGGLVERAWSAGPWPTAASGPWTITGRDDAREGMLRPNPPVVRGWTMSAQVGFRATWETQGLVATASVLGEIPFRTPDDGHWQQLTTDARIEFPTFGAHRLSVELHAVTTFGDVAPPQRFGYLGGSGTLPTFDLLTFGGDEVMFTEGRYTIPMQRVVVPYLGSPRIVLRYMIGGAGQGELPALEQNVGIRLALGLLKLDWTIEPVSGDQDVSVGLTVGR